MRLECHKEPQKATRGHEKQQKATESHKNKSDSRRQFATKNYNRRQLDSCGQLWTVWDSLPQKGADGGNGEQLGIEGCRWGHSGAIQNKTGHEEANLGEVMD